MDLGQSFSDFSEFEGNTLVLIKIKSSEIFLDWFSSNSSVWSIKKKCPRSNRQIKLLFNKFLKSFYTLRTVVGELYSFRRLVFIPSRTTTSDDAT